MSEDNDVLQRATRALRDAHAGDNARSSFTRARVMRSLHADKKRRLSRTLVFGPLAAILVGSTAWAAATGQLPELMERAEHWFVSAQAPTGQTTAIPQPGKKHPNRGAPSVTETVEAPVPQASASVVPTVELAPAEVPTVEPNPPAPVVARKARALPQPAAALPAPTTPAPSEAEPPPEVARDPELAMFRQAHDLHFQGSRPSDAIAAYREYIAAYPSGRFVPEARYNTALNLLKLGQHGRAKALLEPFAAGRYGGYRQTQARDLLDAMAAGGASSRE